MKKQFTCFPILLNLCLHLHIQFNCEFKYRFKYLIQTILLTMWFKYTKQIIRCKIISTVEVIRYELMDVRPGSKKNLIQNRNQLPGRGK